MSTPDLTPAPLRADSCATCRFAKGISFERLYGYNDRLTCRRLPPIATGLTWYADLYNGAARYGLAARDIGFAVDCQWPLVRPSDWCGEHQTQHDRRADPPLADAESRTALETPNA